MNPESLEDVLMLCPPPDDDNSLISYFAISLRSNGVQLIDHGDSFCAIYGKRIGKGSTIVNAIRDCFKDIL